MAVYGFSFGVLAIFHRSSSPPPPLSGLPRRLCHHQIFLAVEILDLSYTYSGFYQSYAHSLACFAVPVVLVAIWGCLLTEWWLYKLVCITVKAMKELKPGKKEIIGDSNPMKEPDYVEGECLAHLLKLIQRGIETTRLSDGKSLPEKIWLKQQFAIGVNEVTRVLQRMKPSVDPRSSPQHTDSMQQSPRDPTVRLQAVVVAADCKPRMLTKHISGLAALRNVPIVYVRDNKRASLRLGELLKLKTALAIGIKVRENAINQLLQPILSGDDVRFFESVEQDGGKVQTQTSVES